MIKKQSFKNPINISSKYCDDSAEEGSRGELTV